MSTRSTAVDIRGADTAQAIEWVQTIYAIPGDENPLFDTTGAFARLGEVGDTLYLAGSFNDDVRVFDVEFGDTLVVPLVNTVSDAFTNSLPDLREDVLQFTQDVDITELFLRVDIGNDGHIDFEKTLDVAGIKYFPEIEFPEEAKPAREFFIEPRPEDKFIFEAPDNAVIGEPFPEDGAASESYTSGYYAQIAGLPKGEHKLAFGGTAFGGEVAISVTDIITVANERPGSHDGKSDGPHADGANDPCDGAPADGYGHDAAPVEACDWIC